MQIYKYFDSKEDSNIISEINGEFRACFLGIEELKDQFCRT